MGRKIVIIIFGIIAFSILSGLLPHNTWFIFRIGILIAVIYACRLAFKHYDKVDKQAINDYLKANNGFPPMTPLPKTDWFKKVKSEHYKFLIAGLAIVVFLLWTPLSAISTYIFMMGDLLTPSYSIHPVIMWAVLGLFLGMIYGGYVAYVKFRLEPKYVLMPAGAFIVLVILLLIHHSYFKDPYQSFGSRTENETPAAAGISYGKPGVFKEKKKRRREQVTVAKTPVVTDSATTDTAAVKEPRFTPGGISGAYSVRSQDTLSRDSTP